MTFHRKKSTILCRISINHQTITSTNEIRDLCVFFQASLSFDLNIKTFCEKKRYSCSGFLREYHNSNNTQCLNTLYISIVLSILGFACVVCLPQYECHISRIESVQIKMLFYALRKSNNDPKIIIFFRLIYRAVTFFELNHSVNAETAKPYVRFLYFIWQVKFQFYFVDAKLQCPLQVYTR